MTTPIPRDYAQLTTMTEQEWDFINGMLGSERLLLLARFWSKCDRQGGIDADWEWNGAYDKKTGRGTYKVGNYTMPAARVAYTLAHGPIARGLLVCHNCPDGDNPRCVNPRHLFLGTYGDNARDAVAKGQIKTGEDHHRAKLTAKQVAEIRSRYTRYLRGTNSTAAMAKEFGVASRTIRAIVSGEHWP